MKKSCLITILFLCLSISTQARVSAAFSWGYEPQIYKFQAFSYSPNRVGYRVSEYSSGLCYQSTTYINFSLSYEFAGKASLTFKSGYKGIDYDYTVLPLELEARFYFSSYESSSYFLCLEAGTALHNWNFEDKIILSALGFGYREHLYKMLSVDFFMKLEGYIGSPLPIDKYEGEIPRPQVYFSQKICVYPNFGIQINF